MFNDKLFNNCANDLAMASNLFWKLIERIRLQTWITRSKTKRTTGKDFIWRITGKCILKPRLSAAFSSCRNFFSLWITANMPIKQSLFASRCEREAISISRGRYFITALSRNALSTYLVCLWPYSGTLLRA